MTKMTKKNRKNYYIYSILKINKYYYIYRIKIFESKKKLSFLTFGHILLILFIL